MSGIAGIIHFDGRPVEPGQVEAMTAAMHYRGPDGIHHWRRGNVALGQCMLRTTPESLEETQPLTNEDESLVLVMDGRVDNWEELRRELLGKGAVLADAGRCGTGALDPVGARIWALMGEGQTLAEICATMLEEYEVEREQLEADVLRLATELAERGLVVPAQ